jgi:CBS domain-containing protein
MRSGELCIRDVVTAFRTESAIEAAQRMAEMGVGDLIVVEEDDGTTRPIGIVTDRDLVVQVLARTDRAASDFKVGEVMKPALVTATEDDDIETVLASLRRNAIRRIPIVDRNGGLQGIISLDDVIEWMTEQMRAATMLLEHQNQRLDSVRTR